MLIRLLLVAPLVSIPLLAAGPASAQSRGEEEARRQLEFAKKEVGEGNFEKALTSADSALRLFPALYDAYVYKALAYEGLGKLKMAESFLLTYRELQPGADADPVAEQALLRIQAKLGKSAEEPTAGTQGDAGRPQGGGRQAPALSLDGMPAYPSGSEEFLRWLVFREQVDTLQARMDVGGGLLAGGLALAGAGAGLMVAMSLVSADNPNDANVEAAYAGGIGSVMAGSTLALVGLPTLAVSGSKLAKAQKATAEAAAAGPRIHFDVEGGALALRF